MIASLAAFNPKEAFDMIKGIWQYVAYTHDRALVYGKHDEQGMRIETDASFAPDGDRSRTGIVIFWRGNLIFWHSSSQSMATLSTAEAEMGATVPGLKYGLAIHTFIMDIEPDTSEEVKKIHLRGDNLATITTLMHQVTSWRTRHYAVKAAWARDIIYAVGIDVKHTPGEFLVADILTKILKGERLKELSSMLGLKSIRDPKIENDKETKRGSGIGLNSGGERSKEECQG